MAELKRRRRVIDTFAARNLHELEKPASIGAAIERGVRDGIVLSELQRKNSELQRKNNEYKKKNKEN